MAKKKASKKKHRSHAQVDKIMQKIKSEIEAGASTAEACKKYKMAPQYFYRKNKIGKAAKKAKTVKVSKAATGNDDVVQAIELKISKLQKQIGVLEGAKEALQAM